MSVPAESVEYVAQTDSGGWRIAGSRVSLDSIVYAFHEGKSAEEIRQLFPSLELEQVYGAIAFYLHHQQMIDEYLSQQADRWKRLQQQAELRNRQLRERVLNRSQATG